MSLIKKGYLLSDTTIEADTFRPQMTSLIDILTLLLVFLIQSFSSEGNLITPSEDLQLPYSSSALTPRPALSIEITKSAVLSEGTIIVPISLLNNSSELLIKNLEQFLLKQYKLQTDTTKAREIIIQCDKNMQFSIVKKVMYTCTYTGFTNFSVLAIEGS